MVSLREKYSDYLEFEAKVLFKFLPKSVIGIVLGHKAYFRHPFPKAALVNHELIHLCQIKEHGLFIFYALYLYYFLKNLVTYWHYDTAYFYIPFEKEAYDNQKDFEYISKKYPNLL